jgi:hypothetical protein
MRPDQGQYSRTAGSGASAQAIARRCAIVVAKEAQVPDHGLNTLGNLGTVG